MASDNDQPEYQAPEPAEELEVPKNALATIARLWDAMVGLRWRIVACTVSAVLYVVATLAAVGFSASVIDMLWAKIQASFASGEPFVLTLENGGARVLTFLGIWTAAWAFYSFNDLVMASFAERLNLRLRERISAKLARLPLSYFDAHQPGDTISRATNDLDKVSEVLQRGVLQLLTSVMTVVGAVLIMLTVDVRLACIFLAFAAVALAVTKVFATRTLKVATVRQASLGALTGRVEEAYSGRAVIKAFGRDEASAGEVLAAAQSLADSSASSDFLTNAVGPAIRFVMRLCQVTIAVLAGQMLIAGQLSVGVFQAFFQYVTQASEPLTQLGLTVNMLQGALAAAERVFGFLEEPEMDAEPTKAELGVADAAASTARTDSGKLAHRGTRANATAGMTASQRSQLLGYDAAGNPRTVRGDVEFSHVRFGYEPGKPIIHDFSASVSAGQKVAIVGPTGAGKTTMVKLLMRFYDVDQGNIKIDGKPIDGLSRHALRSSYGMVLQETWIKDGTVRENIAFGKPDATDEDIIRAAKEAHSWEFIERLPKGLDTALHEDSISQGQKQLLCITRVMLCLPPMLILDEATSSIDTRTELQVQEAFDNLMKGRTSFVVAHRLSTIRNASLILVMKDGKIIEQGTHEELLKEGGFYSHLYNSQFQAVS